MMIRWQLFFIILGIASFFNAPYQAYSAEGLNGTRPNILFIYTDDQSIRTVSCYPQAYDWVRTPHIDKLASEGIRFSAPYIGTWCMPSRASMLTGKHPYGIESMQAVKPYPASTYDPVKCPFWPSEFRKHGYVTGQIGKWHTGTDTGANRDWDYQAVWNRPRYPENAPNYYDDQLIEVNGGKPRMVQGYSTDNYTQWAQEFIRGEHGDVGKPWYLWLCYGGVHGPNTPAERHREAYPGVKVPVPADIYPPRSGKPDWMQTIQTWTPGPDGEPVKKMKNGKSAPELSHEVRRYQQAVMALDEGVGALLKTLEETGQRRNTIVVFTSDQGFAWGQHGFAAKRAGYDANLQPPLIISQPETIPSGAVCDRPVGGVDLIPTFFNLAGIDLPWEMHGHDLTPLLVNPQADWPHGVLIALTEDKFGSKTKNIPVKLDAHEGSNVPWYVMWRKENYKYIRTLVSDELEELYDLSADPEEVHNLSESGQHRQVLERMRNETIDELRRTKAPFIDSLPPVRSE